jgi:hypothetical protein
MDNYARAGSILVALILCSCETSKKLPGRPDVNPAVVSNKQTQKHIGEARSAIKESQLHAAKGADHLKNVDDNLNQLLRQ